MTFNTNENAFHARENLRYAVSGLTNAMARLDNIDTWAKDDCLGYLASAKADIEAAIHCVKAGAFSLPKTFDPVLLVDSEKVLALRGCKIDAIKALRNRAGIGLKEAKDSVEAYLANPT